MPIQIGPGIDIGPGITITSIPPPVLGSLSFDGNTQYLTATLPVSYGTNDFTVEYWIYPSSFNNATFPGMIDTRLNGTDGQGWSVYFSGSNINVRTGASSHTVALATAGISLNTWCHLAVTRTGGNMNLYVNGVNRLTFANSSNFGRTGLYIGQTFDNYNYQGLISNLRIVNGLAVYTGTFTPSTQPLPVTQSANAYGNPSAAITAGQTELLLNTPNNGSYITDSSSYSVSVTNHNSVSASASTPF